MAITKNKLPQDSSISVAKQIEAPRYAPPLSVAAFSVGLPY